MRVVGLVILAIFLPLSAYAAPVNINTADAELLDTLPGIGPTYAERIIEYRTANGPFTRIEDIQNVKGIGPSTYADVAPLITVGDTNAPSSTVATSSMPSATTVLENTVASVPPPSALSIRIDGDQDALVGVPLRLSARATIKGGVVDPSMQIVWSFGDGSSATGNVAEKLYRYAGTYLIVVTVTDGIARARGELTVTAKPVQVRLLPVPGDGITIMNESSKRLDLSGWWLIADRNSFRIPYGMTILPNANVLLPYSITHLPMLSDVTLAYPDGVVAARSVQPAPQMDVAPASGEPAPGGQPSLPAPSYEQVQKVEPIISTRTNIQENEEAVGAPAPVSNKETGAGAVPTTSVVETTAVADAPAIGLLRSPWTLGLLGVMALAGVAFIFL